MGTVHVLGSINMDLVARVDEFPQPGETLMGHDFRTLPGGKGLNQAVAAARAGASGGMRGAVGEGPHGRVLRDFLAEEGVAIDDVVSIPEVATGTALILVDQQGENCIVVVPGANEYVTSAGSLRPESGDLLLAPFEVPDAAIEPAFAEARANGAYTVLNPAPARSCRPGILEQTDLLVVNETELKFFAGHDHPGALPRESVATMVGELSVRHALDVVATLGGGGLVACLDGCVHDLPARVVEVVDTTAAGDTFVGALAAGICRGQTVADSLSFALNAAALCVSRSGAAPSIPELSEILKLD